MANGKARLSSTKGFRPQLWSIRNGIFRTASIVGLAAMLTATPGFAWAQDAIRIGVSLGVDGRYASPSKMQRDAYRLWEADINAAGGLLGRPVEVSILDDNGEQARAIANYQSFADGDDVDIIIGPYSSGLTLAVAPITDASGLAMLAAGASSDAIWDQGFENVFGMWTPASKYTVYMLNIALLNGWERVAVVHADDAFSKSVGKGAVKWVGRMNGLTLVEKRSFVKGTRDLTDLAGELRDADIDLVVMGGHLNESLDMAKAFAEIGWKPPGYFASVGPTFSAFHEQLGDNADCVFSTSIWEPNAGFPGAEDFTERFVAAYGHQPTYHAATAYAAGQLIEEAVTLSGSIENDALSKVFTSLDTFSIIGRYAVDRTGMQSKRFPLLIQWQDGNKEIVWPEDRRTAPLKTDCAN